MSKNTHTKLFKLQFSGASGNNPTLLKTPDFKGFYSSRFAIDSNMTAKNQDALLFTAEHLFYRGPHEAVRLLGVIVKQCLLQ